MGEQIVGGRKTLRAIVVADEGGAALLEELKRAFDARCELVSTLERLRGALSCGLWDIVLFDGALSSCNGLEAFAIAREVVEDLPFILVSGTGSEATVQALRAGAQGFVIKERFERLVPAIEHELCDARVRREKRLAERMASVGALAAVAYEINNPLGAALLNLEIAQEVLNESPSRARESELRGAIMDARSAIARVHAIVGDLRSFTKREVGAGERVASGGLAPAAASSGPPPSKKATPAPAALRRGRVLIVDDEPMLAAAIRRVLMSQHDVVTALHAMDALEKLRSGAIFDVILCDLMMPQITGMELYARIGSEFPEHAPRVVFLTGGAFTPAARDFLAQVPNPTLEKPIDRKGLLALVRERVTTLADSDENAAS